MKSFFLSVFLIFMFSSHLSAQSTFEKDMISTKVAHDTASSVKSEFLAIKQCKKVADKYPDAWLPHFWAAYYTTQLTQYPTKLKGKERSTTFLSYLEEAQKSLNKASRLIPKEAKRGQSSMHSLQSLIYSFKSNLSAGEEKEKYNSLFQEATKKAIKVSPNNPVVLVMLATKMVNQYNSDKDFGKILAGKVLMEKASQTFDLFNESEIHPSLTSHFNQEWVQPWTGYLKKLLNES